MFPHSLFLMLPFLEGQTSPPPDQKVNKGMLQHVGGRKAKNSQVSGGESDFGSQMGVWGNLNQCHTVALALCRFLGV